MQIKVPLLSGRICILVKVRLCELQQQAVVWLRLAVFVRLARGAHMAKARVSLLLLRLDSTLPPPPTLRKQKLHIKCLVRGDGSGDVRGLTWTNWNWDLCKHATKSAYRFKHGRGIQRHKQTHTYTWRIKTVSAHQMLITMDNQYTVFTPLMIAVCQ